MGRGDVNAPRALPVSARSVLQAFGWQLAEATDGLGLPVFGVHEALLGQVGVLGSQARREPVRIEAPRMAEVLRIRCRAAQALRIERFGGPLDLDRIDLLQLSEIIGIGQVTNGVPHR